MIFTMTDTPSKPSTSKIPVPLSVTDPYAEEPSESKSVVCVLHHTDGRSSIIVTDRRVLQRHALLRFGDDLFEFRGDDEIKLNGKTPRWCRIYRQAPIVEVK